MVEVMRRDRIILFEHIERKEMDDCVSDILCERVPYEGYGTKARNGNGPREV